MEYFELDVWKACRKLVNMVYDISKEFPKEELFGLTNQIRRAAVSIPSNIAEGIVRNTNRDTLQFLFVARGSLYELETQGFLAVDQGYLSPADHDKMMVQMVLCKRLLQGLIRYYKNLNATNK